MRTGLRLSEAILASSLQGDRFLRLVVGALALVSSLHCASDSAAVHGSEAPDGFSQSELAEIISSIDPYASGPPAFLQFEHEGVAMACISDASNDRMRIIAPIVEVSELSGQEIAAILEANFHTALDARYATSQGLLYAAFIHPLSPLTDVEVLSAVDQVANLALTFGSSYSSSGLSFGSPDESL